MDFQQTLQHYRQRWHELDAVGLVAHFAPNYHGTYAHSLHQVDVSTRETALSGWSDAFGQFRSMDCRWEFDDLAVRPLAPNGMLRDHQEYNVGP